MSGVCEPPSKLECLDRIVTNRLSEHHPDAHNRLQLIGVRSAKTVLEVYAELSVAQRERYMRFTLPEMVSLAYEIRGNQKRRIERERRAKQPTHCATCGKVQGTCECDW